VPRLLDSLVWQGKPIEPGLIHGDLWDANVGTLEMGKTMVYDAGSYYAHNGDGDCDRARHLCRETRPELL